MASDDDNVSILGIAEGILAKTKKITKYLQDHDIAAPTFSCSSAKVPVTADYHELQMSLKESLEDLQLLVEGPTKFYRNYAMRGHEMAAFQVALEFDFFALVPSSGEISLDELASKAGLDLDRTSRILRLLITHRFFKETTPGFISHNSFSLALQDDEFLSLVHYSFDEMLKADAESGASLKVDPHQSDSFHCPFNVRHGTPIFDYYSTRPMKAARFAKAMAAWRRKLRDNFPWATLNGTIVDIGGGSGHVSIILAQTFPQLNFQVQDDNQEMLDVGQNLLIDDVRDRVSFVKANFFEPQRHKGAAAYMIRQCTHNWADKDVVTMFKSMVPGLEASPPETPLLINEIVLPETGTMSRIREREMRQADMVMLISCGAKQRTKAEFESLLKEADARYEICKVHDSGALGVLEVYLRR
ncbi:hypothetical protein FDECE_3407 [Fusarium decemcellulare]|nr:hypothetical protein FDECE_3407 [Fusarium decemcellulare]